MKSKIGKFDIFACVVRDEIIYTPEFYSESFPTSSVLIRTSDNCESTTI
jgi:hypothetical protein